MENMKVCTASCYQLSKLAEVYYMRWETKLRNQCHCQADIAENISYVRKEGDRLNICDVWYVDTNVVDYERKTRVAKQTLYSQEYCNQQISRFL
jgi:hypothetical protein